MVTGVPGVIVLFASSVSVTSDGGELTTFVILPLMLNTSPKA